ncbi:sclerostin domain-containing protein 1a [Neosynchiropus ocellatus]
MHPNLPDHRTLVLLCLLLRNSLSFKNDGTELLLSHVSATVPEPQSNVSLNRARTGGRAAAGPAHDRGERTQIGCRELRSTKYISDGHCTSINPVKELVCAGECLPAQMLQNWIGGTHGKKFWGRRSGGSEWRCVNDKTRTQRIQLQCQDGSTRTYKITVVTSCKCKRYSRQQNESAHEETSLSPLLLRAHTSKRRSAKKPLSANWHDAEP